MLRLCYRVHKWVGVGIGVCLAMWVVTGILLRDADDEPALPAVPLALDRVAVTPAAAARVAGAGGTLGDVAAVELDMVAGQPVYRVRGTRATRLVDATTGTPFEVTEQAARTATAALVPGAVVRGAHLIRRYDRGYAGGALPAWRVQVEGPGNVLVHLDAEGRLHRSDRSRQLHVVTHGLHTFASLGGAGLGHGAIRAVFLVASLIALALVATGYWMALPRRSRG